MIKLIEDTQTLEQFCRSLQDQEFMTVDFEFMREKTYYAKLCLIQVGSEKDCAVIDPLAKGIELDCFYQLLFNPQITKVFHSGRQDLEIVYNLTGKLPTPLFDTQIAAQVFGFGESVGYENLVKSILKISLDKTSRLSDWSKRPLNDTQLQYALSDVTHLVRLYRYFSSRLKENHRDLWISEEMETLKDPALYHVDPADAWQKIRHRSHNAHMLTLLRELAAWREKKAMDHNIPRQMIIKDDCLIAVASINPGNKEELKGIRNMRSDVASGRLGDEILNVLEACRHIPTEQYVTPPEFKETAGGCSAMFDLLRLLLRLVSNQNQIIPRLIASEEDLKNFSAFADDDLPLLKGWRRELFGNLALELREGNLSIRFNPQVRNIELVHKKSGRPS